MFNKHNLSIIPSVWSSREDYVIQYSQEKWHNLPPQALIGRLDGWIAPVRWVDRTTDACHRGGVPALPLGRQPTLAPAGATGSRSSRGASGRSRGVPGGMRLMLSERERPCLPSATLTSPPGSRICARVREDPLHHTRDLGLLGLLASCC